MPPRRRPPPPRRFPVVKILLGVFVVWGGLWLVTSIRFQKQIEGWLAAERAAGYEFSFDENRSSGSPFAVTRGFRNLNWKNGKSTSFHANVLTLTTRPWDWRAFEAAFHHGAELTTTLPGSKDPLTFQGEQGSVDFFLPLLAPIDHTETGLSLSGQAERLLIKTPKPQPFGDTIGRADVALHVMGPLPDFTKKDSVIAWNADSGVIEVDAFNLDWGVLKLSVKGTLALDTALQPEGAFSGQIGNREAVVKALVDKNWIKKNEAGLLNATLNQLPKSAGAEKKNGSSDTPGETIPLSVQSGGLFLGPVRVITIPALIWK